MLKMTRAQLAPEPVKVPEVAPVAPAKDPAPDLMPTMMALAQSVQQVAQIVADSAQQNADALAKLAANKDRKPTGMESVIKRDANKLMTRIITKLTYEA